MFSKTQSQCFTDAYLYDNVLCLCFVGADISRDMRLSGRLSSIVGFIKSPLLIAINIDVGLMCQLVNIQYFPFLHI